MKVVQAGEAVAALRRGQALGGTRAQFRFDGGEMPPDARLFGFGKVDARFVVGVGLGIGQMRGGGENPEYKQDAECLHIPSNRVVPHVFNIGGSWPGVFTWLKKTVRRRGAPFRIVYA
ncbi:MAG: hypothetical protein K0Q91_675 [Fibrobacteria bacterium]|nr:hypothetical protein [Fibrobacteria bacterium]